MSVLKAIAGRALDAACPEPSAVDATANQGSDTTTYGSRPPRQSSIRLIADEGAGRGGASLVG